MIITRFILFAILIIGLAAQAKCPDFCNDCDPSGKVCFACKQDYQLSVLGKCVSNVVDKCIVYGPTNQCFVCQPSFELVGNKCVKQYNGCLRKNTMDNQCYECGFGKALQNNVCVGTLNCEQPEAVCQTCAKGFELKSDGKCYDISEGCQKQGSMEGICEICKTGYKMIGYRCIKQTVFVPYCYIYYNENSCEICKNGYSFFQNFCLLPTHIQSILSGQTTVEATIAKIKAQMGIINVQPSGNNNPNPNNNGNSKQNQNKNNPGSTSTPTNPPVNPNPTPSFTPIKFCSNQQGNVCISCQNGYVVSSNTCIPMDPNCSSYELSTGKCVACIPTFQLSNTNTCVPKPVIPQIQNCQVTDPQDPRFCLICVYGFYPTGNICAKVSRFCDGHNVQTGDCFGCLFGLQLVNGKCVDKNCNSLSSAQICTSCATSYKPNSNGVCEYSDPNCVTSKNGKCETCVTGFYPSVQGKCFKLPTNCQFGNVVTEGSCAQCNNGYALQQNGGCQLIIPNCQLVQNNLCQNCNSGFYLKNNACLKVSILCNGYNPTSGACLGCLTGYTLINGNCYDLNCVNQNQEKCSQCKTNYRVVAPSNLCTFFDVNCLTLGNNVCQTCNTGFSVGSSGLCEKIPTNNGGSSNGGGAVIVTPSDPKRDPYCKEFINNKCNTCSNRYYIGAEGKCVPVNAYCNDYNRISGACTTCYRGFSLSNGLCVPSAQDDPYCKTRNKDTNACIDCYSGYWLNGAKCAPLNPLCQTSNLKNGQCQTCYPGYTLVNGNCVVSFKDPNCQQYSASGVCNKCSTRYYYDQLKTKCVAVNILCKDYNQLTGACLGCYSGYKLNAGNCEVVTVSNSDVNCKTSSGNNCVECYGGYYPKAGKCERINVLCQTANPQTGACTSCYQGYALSNGQCVVSDSGDVNCKQYTDNTKKSCKTCYSYYYPKLGVCTKFNDLCNGSNPNTGACLGCYQGYVLVNGDCVISQQVSPSEQADPYCIKFQNNVCTKCASGYYLSNLICQASDPLCKTTNPISGQCMECYQGYVPSGKTCVVPVIIQVPYCSVPSLDGTCIQCIDGYYLRNGNCQPVSILCGGKYNKQTGQCTGCADGYFLQGGECIYPALGVDSACEKYSAGGFCERCSLGFYLLNYRCTQIDNFCTKFDYSRSQCTECFNKTPMGAGCV